MGNIEKKEKNICVRCGNKAGMLTRTATAEGMLCLDCLNELMIPIGTNLSYMTMSQVTDLSEQLKVMREKREQFTPTFAVGQYAKFNDETRQMILAEKAHFKFKLEDYKLYEYSDIVDFELLEDGNSVASGGLGRAAVGAITFGAAGAVVGAVTGKKKNKNTCTSLSIKVTVKNSVMPAHYIKFIESETKRDGFIYKTNIGAAQDIIAKLQTIVSEEQQKIAANMQATQAPSAPVSNADEIKKYKDLLDIGAITQEEFDAKKKQLLGL